MRRTFAARPAPVPKRFLLANMAAFRTPLAGEEPLVGNNELVGNDERPHMPLAFVSETTNDLIPTSPVNMAGEILVLLHVLHRKVLGPQITSKSWASRMVSFSMKSLRRN